MTPEERQKAGAFLEETRENMLRAAKGLSPAQLDTSPRPIVGPLPNAWNMRRWSKPLVLGNIHNAIKEVAGSPKTDMTRRGPRPRGQRS